jgi:hypothetical protein
VVEVVEVPQYLRLVVGLLVVLEVLVEVEEVVVEQQRLRVPQQVGRAGRVVEER